EDCNDLDAAVHPNAGELCDGIDNNCDTLTDSGLIAEPRAFYLDLDGDGAGDPSASYAQSCSAPVDGRTWVDAGTDCDDTDPDIVPGADEVCDGIDNDCDALIDDQDNDTIGATWYVDTDSDGFGAGAPSSACAQPAGYVANDDDCDDSRNDINPGIPEECDGYDNDCDGFIDGADSQVVGNVDWYPDADSDGYGDANATLVEACVAPAQHVANNLDCDDTAAAVSPAALEVCDGQDNDCDTDVDDDDSFVVGGQIWYTDSDQDGVGGSTSIFSCSQPLDAQQVPTAVAITGDCDDADAARFPGNLEVCDGIDGDCDGTADSDEAIPPVGSVDAWTDGDGDGYGTGARQEVCLAGARAVLAVGLADRDGDCDDVRADVNPGVVAEICEAGVGADLDCDGLFGPDDPDYDGTNGFVYAQDVDGDTYGNPLFTIDSCSAFPRAGYSSRLTDCDDTDASVYPDMPWYADTDQDGFGDLNSMTNSPTGTCEKPVGDFVANTEDCNDNDGTIHPYGIELCDSIDNDCDGLVDDEDDVVGDDGKFFEDHDGDGWGDPMTAVSSCTGQVPTSGGPWVNDGYDCNDADASINPQAQETCDDLEDSDCDGGDNTTFDPQATLLGGNNYYLDVDQDAYFDQSPTSSCDVPTISYQGSPGTDCDDRDAQAHPGAILNVGSTRQLRDLQDVLYNARMCPNTTIQLDAETYEGGLSFNARSDVTVRGMGAGQTILDGVGDYRAVDGVGNNTTIEALTIINAGGGGVQLQSVQNVVFRDVDVGDEAIDPSFSSGTNGAALYAYDTGLTLENVNVFNAVSTSSQRGGCLYLTGRGAGGTILTNVVLQGCRANTGAAIYHDDGDVTANDLTIRQSATDDPEFGSRGVWYSQAGNTTVSDLTYVENQGVVWLNGGVSSATFTRTYAFQNDYGVFELNSVGATWSNILSIRNGNLGYPSIAMANSFGNLVDQGTFIRDNQSIAVAGGDAIVSNVLFVDATDTLSESGPGEIELTGAMSSHLDLWNAVQNQTGVTESVAMDFQSYHHDPFGVSLPVQYIDASPTGSWNIGSFGAHHGADAGWWDYSINSDGDSLPDAWEIWWLGDTSQGDADDTEPDNYSNLAEYTAGTNPSDPDTDQDGTDDVDDNAPLDAVAQ
ncbi:MAG: hypothetical protein KC912_24625, partial [Proteobacteria bacterium]|nr:hypothetical protein [Pseudomonadota bacterium]